MKQSIPLLFAALIILQGCTKGDDPVIPRCDDCEFTCIDEDNTLDVWVNDCKNNWSCTFEVLRNSTIGTDLVTGVQEGDNTVFRMQSSTEGDIAIADDEFTVILIFELDSGQDSFSVVDEELDALNVYHKYVCFCPAVEFRPAVSGCLQGERQDDGSWYLQCNLTFSNPNFDNPLEVLVDAQFTE